MSSSLQNISNCVENVVYRALQVVCTSSLTHARKIPESITIIADLRSLLVWV